MRADVPPEPLPSATAERHGLHGALEGDEQRTLQKMFISSGFVPDLRKKY